MALQLSISSLCGQLLVGGFEGETLPARLGAALRAGRRGGVILFKRNLPSSEHARVICAEVMDACQRELPPFFGVDEEGGRVSRLRSPVLRLPPMRKLANRGDADLLTRAGSLLGKQLAALGFNLNFAPVLDVDTNPQNPVIGDRSFGSTPEDVCINALAFWQGLGRHVLGCGKHFPGHGDTAVDSHIGLPVIEHERSRLQEIELVPFIAAARANIDALMSAHIVVKSLDLVHPATLSRAVCTDLLRRDLGFTGVLFSDDLEMGAIASHYTIEDAAVLAIEAGCDALLICKSEEAQERAHAALVRKAERDKAFLKRCSEAAIRGLNARRRRVPNPIFNEAVFQGLMGQSRQLEAEIKKRIG
jgi:beta-N-acetylhexosaminidase